MPSINATLGFQTDVDREISKSSFSIEESSFSIEESSFMLTAAAEELLAPPNSRR